MLKTEQARTGMFTTRVDKPVNQTAFIGGKRKPQYLDVVLASGSKNEKLTENVTKSGTRKNVKSETGLKKDKNIVKVNALSGKPSSTAVYNVPKFNLSGNKTTGKKSKPESGEISPTQKPATFRDRQKIENLKKQKLYESLDRMLDGQDSEKPLYSVRQQSEPSERSPEKTGRVNKYANVSVVTKESLYPAISQEARSRHGGNISHRDSTVPPLIDLGTDSESLHLRELKAHERLERLDKINDFSLKKSPRKSYDPSTDKNKVFEQPSTQTISVGIPVNAGNTTSRRHIVADIPVYFPSFAGGNQPVQAVVKETAPVPVNTVYERTIPGVAGKPLQESGRRLPHAPEAFLNPVPGLDTISTEIQGNEPVLNTYRQTGNPVSERLLKEKAERERSLLEKENLNYFDIEPETDALNKTDPIVRASIESDKKSVAGTLLSDPGPRRSTNTVRPRASPDSYLAQKERQARLEKAERLLKRAEEERLLISSEPMTQRTFRNEPPKYDNRYQIDFYAQKSRSEIRSSKKIDREDSWIKKQLEQPHQSPAAMDTYKNQGQGYRSGGQDGNSNRDDGQSTYRVNEYERKYKYDNNDRNANKSYQRPRETDTQDRYGSPGERERNYRRDQDSGPRYDPRYERDRQDVRNDRGSYRDERDRSEYNKDRRNNEKGSRDLSTQRSESDGYGKPRGHFNDDKREYERKSNEIRNAERNPRQNVDDRHADTSRPERTDNRYERGYTHDNRDRRQFDNKDRNQVSNRHDIDRSDYRRDGRREEKEPHDSQYDSRMTDDRYKKDRFEQVQRDSNERMDNSREYGKNNKNYTRTDSEKVRSNSPVPKTVDGKVQYVLKAKTDSSRNEMRKSQMSHKSDPLPENIPPSSKEIVRDKSAKSSHYDKRPNEMDSRPKPVPQELARSAESNLDKPISVKREYNQANAKPPTYETSSLKPNDKGNDDLNRFFDEPERAGSPSNVIPFYSDNISTYSKPRHNFRHGELMTPVQEMSVKMSEDDDGQLSKTDRGSGKTQNDRAKFLSSNENKHVIKEDRRSPWRPKGDPNTDVESPSLKDEPPTRLTETYDTNKGPDSVVEMKERIREQTAEKITEIRKERKREKTIDSQGPTDNKDDIHDDEIDIDDLNLDSVETEMDEREMYVCYLLTDNGEKIGPLKLDINDVQVGLPNPDKLPDLPEQTGEVEDEGMRNRQTGSHGLNEFSSRSHSMLMLTIDSEMQDPDDENLYITKRGKLTFVDLAGSEKVKDSNSTADTLVESNSINKSLLVLGNCISSLGDQKRRQGHIPYRDSKLTKLLADSLGGNGVTLMICCITPSSHHAPETMNTLRYASRAKKIRTKPVIKMDPREKLILSLKREIKVLRNENHYLRQQNGIPKKVQPKAKPVDEVHEPKENIKKISDIIKNPKTNNEMNKDPPKPASEKLEFPAKPKGQIQKENDQKIAKFVKETNGKPETNNTVNNIDEKLKNGGGSADEGGLYEMLQEYMVENEALRTENAEMQVNKDKGRQDQQFLYRDNERLMKRVDELERRLNQAQASWQTMPRQGSHQSREHSPRASPQYNRAVGGNGKPSQARFPQPPNDLPMRDNPALRDPVYPGSPPQGYNSPTSNGRRQQPSPSRQPPLKPPHRLVDTIPQQRPVHEQNGPPYMNGHPGGHQGPPHPAMHPSQVGGPYRQAHIGSPNKPNEIRMDSRRSSQSTSSDAIRDMNEKLKQELMQLDGEIHHHQAINHHRSNNQYGSQGSMR